MTNFRIALQQSGCQRHGSPDPDPLSLRFFLFAVEAIDFVRVFVAGVIAPLVPDEEKSQDAERQTDTQSQHVDPGIDPVPQQIPPGDDEIVSQHHLLLSLVPQRIDRVR